MENNPVYQEDIREELIGGKIDAMSPGLCSTTTALPLTLPIYLRLV